MFQMVRQIYIYCHLLANEELGDENPCFQSCKRSWDPIWGRCSRAIGTELDLGIWGWCFLVIQSNQIISDHRAEAETRNQESVLAMNLQLFCRSWQCWYHFIPFHWNRDIPINFYIQQSLISLKSFISLLKIPLNHIESLVGSLCFSGLCWAIPSCAMEIRQDFRLLVVIVDDSEVIFGALG